MNLEELAQTGLEKEEVGRMLTEIKDAEKSGYHTNIAHIIEKLRKLENVGLVTVEHRGYIADDEQLADGELVKAAMTKDGEELYDCFCVKL
jgi:hypothetical protein